MEFYSRSNGVTGTGFLDTMVSVCSQIGQFAVSRADERALLLRDHELSLAKRIQQCWQPHDSPNIPGYDIAGSSIAAQEVGGDYFDFFPTSGGRTGIAIGDAAGHGFDSALHIAEVRAYIRALSATDYSLPRIFGLTNQHFIEHSDGGSFVTLLLARLDPATGELTYANAGHLSAWFFDANGKHHTTMASTGFPLGVIRCAPFPTGPPVRLKPGDWVLMFTDGVIEARDKSGEPLGVNRLLELARETHTGRCARDAAPGLLNRVAEFVDGPLDDDMTVVLIARNEGGNRQ
jgi:sigma-B regulation protein RsbU (phosphoserine phosphatase)